MMKVALINGSPKVKESASGTIIDDLQEQIKKYNINIFMCDLHKPQISDEQKEELYSCDSLIFVFPLYVDGIPSHLLHCLKALQEYFNIKDSKPIKIYTIINCGFYEGRQNTVAIDILKNWSYRAGLLWGQGIGIGAGGMLPFLKNVPIGFGPKKNLGKAFNEFVPNIVNGKEEDSIFISPNFPKFAYKISAQIGWKKQAKANGLLVKDLFRKL